MPSKKKVVGENPEARYHCVVDPRDRLRVEILNSAFGDTGDVIFSAKTPESNAIIIRLSKKDRFNLSKFLLNV